MLILLINILIRERFQLKEKQRETLLLFFPEEHINRISFYKRGVFSIGSTKVLCNSIYFRDKSYWDKRFFTQPNSEFSLSLLVHGTTHTWQSRKGCLKMISSSLYNQFKSFLKYGSRSYAYYYSLEDNAEDLNVEQEASIVQDFYLASFTDMEEIGFICQDCPYPITETALEKLKIKTERIIEKYK